MTLLFNINRYKDFRAKNKRSWSEIYHFVTKLPYDIHKCVPQLEFSQVELETIKFKLTNLKLKYNKIVGLCVGSHSRDKQKRWPLRNFLDLAFKLDRKNAIFFIIGPDEREYINEVEKEMQQNYFIKYSEDIRQSIINIQLCDVVVSNDSFPLHISYTLNKETIALFGPDNPCQVQDKSNLYKFREFTECLPCHSRICKYGDCRCCSRISVEQIFNKVKELI